MFFKYKITWTRIYAAIPNTCPILRTLVIYFMHYFKMHTIYGALRSTRGWCSYIIWQTCAWRFISNCSALAELSARRRVAWINVLPYWWWFGTRDERVSCDMELHFSNWQLLDLKNSYKPISSAGQLHIGEWFTTRQMAEKEIF
jgi:hypothetical protein